MEIVQVKTSELVPYERNAKEHPQEQVEQIANSIKAFGFRSPIVAWKDGTIINGHGRLLAAYKLGLEEVPVIYADDLTEEEANAFRLADNKTSESSWDEFLLADELADLFDFDMERFGFEFLSPDSFGEDFSLPSGEHGNYYYMTFTVSGEQRDEILNILKKADAPAEVYGNTNKNANALYKVVTEWDAQKKYK